MAKVDVTAKLHTTAAKINALPPARRTQLRARLSALEVKAGTPNVAGTSRPGSFPGAKPAQPKKTVVAKPAKKPGTSLTLIKSPPPKVEWDLAFANELDAIYTAVADRATEVRKTAVKATGQTASDLAAPIATLGFGLWPLAIAALALVWAYRKGLGA